MCAFAAGLVMLTAAASAGAPPFTLAAFVTSASPSVSIGGTITDTAVVIGSPVIGAPKPGGTVTFNLYGPNDATCAGPEAAGFPATVGVKQNTKSARFTPTLPGTYRFLATYSGDMNYPPASGKCSDSTEAVLVTAVTPKLTTTASPTVAVGGTVTDTATLTGGVAPTGSIEFGLFPPNDPTCSGGVVFRSTVPITDPASTVSESYSPPIAGTYHWEARYTGDSTNGAVRSGCSDAGESVDVTAAPPGSGKPGGPPSTGPGSPPPPAACDPVATAHAVLAGLAATLAGKAGAGFRSTCSAGLRVVLRAKEIRPGNPGSPRKDGYTTAANILAHISPSGPALSFSLNANGVALRDYALSHRQSLIAFLVVHVRPDKRLISTEALQILSLG